MQHRTLNKRKGAHNEQGWKVPACRESAHEAVVLSFGPFAGYLDR